MEDWRLLCKNKDTEDVILSKLREIGVSAHIKHVVQSKIEDESTKFSDLEETVHASVNMPGTQHPLPSINYCNYSKLFIKYTKHVDSEHRQ